MPPPDRELLAVPDDDSNVRAVDRAPGLAEAAVRRGRVAVAVSDRPDLDRVDRGLRDRAYEAERTICGGLCGGHRGPEAIPAATIERDADGAHRRHLRRQPPAQQRAMVPAVELSAQGQLRRERHVGPELVRRGWVGVSGGLRVADER